MPRVSKRKRQLAGMRVEGEEEEEDSSPASSMMQTTATSTIAKPAPSSSTATTSHPPAVKPAASTSSKKKSTASPEVEDEAVWVQCDKCEKWRALAPDVNAKNLPDIWTCSLAPPLTCNDPEQPYESQREDQDIKLRYFFRVWLKKLRCSDRAEARIIPSTLTRGRRRQIDSEWIRCCNPSCGKWRSTLRGMDAGDVLKRLNKKCWGAKTLWYCSMNSWDETLASCAVESCYCLFINTS